jgi:hypothetical protein
MSFDVFLFRVLQGRNAPEDPTAFAAVHGVFDAFSAALPADFRFSVAKREDGVLDVNLDGDGAYFRSTSGSFHLHSFHPRVIRLIFDAAKAGGFVILPCMESIGFILTDPSQAKHLPPDTDMPAPILCQGASDFQLLIKRGYLGRRKYRDQVVPKPDDPEAQGGPGTWICK